jgi:hypothetical protein
VLHGFAALIHQGAHAVVTSVSQACRLSKSSLQTPLTTKFGTFRRDHRRIFWRNIHVDFVLSFKPSADEPIDPVRRLLNLNSTSILSMVGRVGRSSHRFGRFGAPDGRVDPSHATSPAEAVGTGQFGTVLVQRIPSRPRERTTGRKKTLR